MSERRMFQVVDPEWKLKKDGETKYLRAKCAGIGWASFWSTTDGKLIMENPDATFEGDVETKGDFTNISSVALSNGTAPVSASKPSGDTETMSKGDWNAKEDREAFRIAWSVVYKAERDNGTEPEKAFTIALEYAQLLNSAAWARSKELPF